LYNDGVWVYDATVYSPQSAALYGNTNPVSDLDWQNGVSPTFSLAQGDTAYPNTPVFDMILPPGETQVTLVFSLSQLVNQYYYYGVIGTGSNPTEGQWTLTFSTTNTSTVTVSNGNAEADFSTSIHYVCYQPPVLPQQTNLTVAPLTLVAVANTATNFNPPGVVLTYQLLNAPNGASIDTNGVITWTPSAAQGSTAYPITTVVSDGTSSVTNSFVVNVVAPPVASVVTNALAICGTNCTSLGGSVSGCATGGVWTTTGAGTFSPDATTVSAAYCPSPADYGQAITNTLTTQGPCAPYSAVTAQVVVTVIAPPVAGVVTNALATCGTTCISLGGSVGGCATGGVWTTTGAGTFSPDATTVNAAYCPSPADLGQTVTNTLTSQGPCAPCGAATAQVVVAVIAPPAAGVAANALTTCGTTCVSLGGSVSGCATGGSWTTTGTGAFTPDATTVNASYCPSAADVAAHAVTLTLTSTGPCAPCGAATAQVALTINTPATASTSGNQAIYVGQNTAPLGGSVGGGASGGVWSASSAPNAGTFSPSATALNATYNPSATDIANGTVTLTLTSAGQVAPCPAATAQVVVDITSRIITTTMLTFTNPQTYGSTVLSATVTSTNGASGIVTFMDGTNNLASVSLTNGMASLATNLTVAGSPHAIQAVFSDPSDEYHGSSSVVSNLTVLAREVTLGGSKSYDGTTTVTPAQGLALQNNVDGDSLFLSPTDGIVYLASRNAGLEPVISVWSTNIFSYTTNYVLCDPPYTTNWGAPYACVTNWAAPYVCGTNWGAPYACGTNYGTPYACGTNYGAPYACAWATPTRVNSVTGTGGSWSYGQGASFGTSSFTTTSGDTLVAMINTDSDGSGRVSGVSGPGSIGWTRLQNGSSNGGNTVYWCLTELWYAPNVSGGQSGGVTININSTGYLTRFLVGCAVVNEYGNVSGSSYDNSTCNSGSSSPAQSGSMSTGASGSQYEVYVAGLGNANSSGTCTLSGQSSGWNYVNSTSVNTTVSGYGTYNSIYAYDQFVTSSTTASCQANQSVGTAWSGAMVALKGSMPVTGYCSNILSFNYCSNIVGYSYCSNIVSYNYCSNIVSYGYCSNVVSLTTNWCVGSITTNYTNVANVALAGSAAPNYALTYSGAVMINPYPVMVAATAASKIYDGTTNAAGVATVTTNGVAVPSGFLIGGDAYAPASPGQSFASRNVASGSAVIVPAAITVTDGNGGANYSVTYSNYTGGTISAMALTVTAAPNTKPYDGTTGAVATPSLTAGSIQTGDSAPVWTETYDTPDVGTGKTLTPAGLVLDGNGGANYSYTYAQNFMGVITALPTTTLLGSSINPSVVGSNVTFTATVSDTGPYPTGNVVFSANDTPFATNGLSMLSSASSVATASTTALPVGTNSIVAQYLGGVDYQSSTSGALAQVVTNNVIYSQTNIITSVVNNHNGSFTLHFTGTPGAQYYVVATSVIKTHTASWIPVQGTTNVTASSPSGAWSCVVSNPAPAYYRPVAVNPAP